MEFKVSELEREPIDFDLELAPGAVDLGEEAEQVGQSGYGGPGGGAARASRALGILWPTSGCGAGFPGKFQVPCARCVEPVEIPLERRFRPDFPAGSRRIPSLRNGRLLRRKRKSVIIKETVCCLKMCCASRCFCPCRSGRCASLIAKDFARAAVRTATAQQCNCEEGPGDPRWEALAGLRGRIKS